MERIQRQDCKEESCLICFQIHSLYLLEKLTGDHESMNMQMFSSQNVRCWTQNIRTEMFSLSTDTRRLHFTQGFLVMSRIMFKGIPLKRRGQRKCHENSLLVTTTETAFCTGKLLSSGDVFVMLASEHMNIDFNPRSDQQ